MIVLMDDDDSILLLHMAAGDERAFNALFERYKLKLYNYLVRITKSPEVSEEIIVDIFVKLWVGRELMNNIQNLDRFLHKVVYHRAIDFLRVASRHARLQRAYIARAEAQSVKLPDELMIDEECRQIFQKAIHQLPAQRKLIYQLSREQGLTHKQIAIALNLSSSTVRNSIMAANKSISKYLVAHSHAKTIIPLLFLIG